jgi:hypothetical protein
VPREGENGESGTDNESLSKKKDKEDVGGSILWGRGGLSILPHGNFPVLEAITRILLSRQEHDRLIELYVKHLSIPETPEVWQGLLALFRYIHPTDLDRLGGLVTSLLERYPELISKQETAVMLAFLQWRLPEVVQSAIAHWRNSALPNVQQAYGEIVTLMAFSKPEMKWPKEKLSEIVQGSDLPDARIGVAYAAVNLWGEHAYRASASSVLQAIVPKADGRIWTAVFELFMLVDEITPEPEWISLLEVIAEHLPATKRVESSYVVDRLQTLLPHQAPLVARLASRLVANWRSELGDLSTSTAMVAGDLVDMAITLHRLGPETREAGTSLFEDLLDINAHTAQETLSEIDNRFRSTPTQARRRLPRRRRGGRG